MIEKKISSAIPIYAFGVSFMVISAILPMYRFYNFICCLGISFIISLIATRTAPVKTIMKEAPLKDADTGDKNLDALIDEGRHSLTQLKALIPQIDNPHVVEDIRELKSYGDKIFNYLEENPKKASSIRQFMDYYLPTTLKLSENYVSMKKQKANGENIDRASAKIEQALDTAVIAFKKQFDNMYETSAMDIIAEVNVMEKLLKAEGLLQGESAEKKGGGK